MAKKWYRIIFILLISFTLFTCIDPYVPQLRSFESRLVVDALITDEVTANYVRLSRTVSKPDDVTEKVTGATVVLTDDLGNSFILEERNPGDYRTDSLLFRGEPGRTYTLSVETAEGGQYESTPCMMLPVQDIDSLYYQRDRIFSDETGEFREGITFYIDSEEESTAGHYRWSYDEWWKFSVPDPSLFRYINDSTILQVDTIKRTCYAHVHSDVIDIENTVSGNTENLKGKAVHFVAPDESDRLLIQYCLEVRQMSLSAEEYEFWYLMSGINEAGGDIFDKQPYQVFSNIRNLNDPEDQVIGYFQVSAVKMQRLYVTVREALALGLPMYQYECDRQEKGPSDYPSISPGGGMTFDEIYWAHLNSGYTFIKPIFTDQNALYRLAFVRSACADCTLRGTLQKPWFWVDLN